MADYTPLGNWYNQAEDGTIQDGATPLSAENIQHMEDGIAGSLQKSGGIMTGSLVLNEEPSEDMHAVTKKYADANMGVVLLDSLYENWIDENTSVGRIPNFDPNKYTIFTIANGTNGASRSKTYFTYVPLDTWVIACNYYDYALSIKISSAGEIFFSSNDKHNPSYLLLFPMRVITLE